MQVGGQNIELRAGEQLVVTGSSTAGFADVNPLPGLACRDLSEHALSDGQRAFICQFSLLSALHDLKTLKQLSHSPESRERAIYGKILKNAAVLHMVTARKGPYKKFGKKETAEQAI